jgi:putative ABC transport system permease protein
MSDWKYAVRMFLKNPGFTAIAIITLALGIGINTTIFSVVNAILLRPLSFPQPERIISVLTQVQGSEPDIFSPANYLDVAAQNKSFSSTAAVAYFGFDLTGKGEPVAITAAKVSHGFFDVVGVQPVLGRSFTAQEDSKGNNLVVILGHSLWKRQFGGDPQILNKVISLDGSPFTVLGVMPEGFEFPPEVEIWAPIAFTENQKNLRGAIYVDVIARLKNGISHKQAQAEMDTLAARLAKDYPEYNSNTAIRLIPLQDQMVGESRTALLVLTGAVIFVLLVACANLANLLITRMSGRGREFAVRIALGASPRRLLRQMLTESILLSMIGGAIGILFSLWGIPAVLSLTPEDLPRVNEVRLDSAVLFFAIGISVVTGILFGIAPALNSSHPDLNHELKEGTAGAGTGTHRMRLRNSLIVAEIATVLILLVGAGLMIRSFDRLRSVDPGFRAERLLNLQVFLPASRYQERERKIAFHDAVLEQTAGLSGVKSAAIVSPAPFSVLSNYVDTYYGVEGLPPANQERPVASYTRVSAGYFSTMMIPVHRGREFTKDDRDGAPRVAVVNQLLAQKYWPDGNAVGKHLILEIQQPQPLRLEIVGVVGNVQQLNLRTGREQIYIPYVQSPVHEVSLMVRTAGDPLSATNELKARFWRVDPLLPAQYLATMESLVGRSLTGSRSSAILLSIFAALALTLAMIGLYGVISHSVYQRTREIGVRMTLGAQRTDILKLILGQGLRLTAAGLLFGLTGALALARLMGSLLFHVRSWDPMTFVLVACLMSFVSMLACYLPARRAMRVDPVVALRYE